MTQTHLRSRAHGWRRGTKLVLAVLSMAIGSFAPQGDAVADQMSDFYAGKRINLLVGVAAGGDYDFKMRLVGRHIGAFIPGNPAIVPQNMLGATGLAMANFLYNAAPRDGTYIGLVQNGLPTFQTVGMPGAQFEPAKFNWIGSLAPSVETMAVWRSAGVRTVKDAIGRELVAGAVGATGISTAFPRMLNELIGTRFRVVGGYPGAGAVNLALERGEVEARSNAWSAWKTANGDWLRNGDLIIILHASRKPIVDLEGVPSLYDLVSSDEDRALINLVTAGGQFGHPFATSPGVPKERVEGLRAAFMAMVNSPAFKAEAEAAKSDLDPVTGPDLQAVAESLAKTPENVRTRARKLLE